VNKTRRQKIVVFLSLAAASCGCGNRKSGAVNIQRSHVHSLAAQYLRASSKLKHPPKNEQEFKQALAQLNLPLEALKVGSIDELFLSERDHEPLIVVYGPLPKGSDVVVYEKTGIDGARYVGHMSGMVEEVNEQDFNKAIASTR
jgi:hypothetical protein